tara:strand:- start:48 stop:209 length:162 start_codon:yes stop_codon:yes gene_type:complete
MHHITVQEAEVAHLKQDKTPVILGMAEPVSHHQLLERQSITLAVAADVPITQM